MAEKRIALLVSSFLPQLGGMEIGLHNIAIRIKQRGYEPVVIAPHPHVRALREKGWQLPYKVVALPPKIWSIVDRWPELGFAILDFYLGFLQRKYQFDFWHVTMGYPSGCAMIHFARHMKGKVQYLIRCAGEDIQKQADIGYGVRLNPRLDKLITSYLRQAQRLVAITDSVYREYKAIGVPDSAIYRIPNGVPLNRFSCNTDRQKTRKAYELPADKKLILSVGRNHPKKNYKNLIVAAGALLKGGCKDFHVLCVGKGCAALSPLVDEHNLEGRVTLLEEIGGRVNPAHVALPSDELIALYKSSDLFAFPSLMETFGIAIVEAMAAGLPVIVGDSEGCRDIVGQGRWGLMCDPEDPADLAAKLKALIDTPALCEEYRMKSLQRAKDFDWDHIADLYTAIYDGRRPD